MSHPWRSGSVTGIGSLPGTDPREAATLVLGELPELPHLPELPARGPGAGMVGRSASLLVELPAELVPTGWRMTAAPGRDLRAARDDLARDLDALEEVATGYAGPIKLQVAGPWTLAASIELSAGHRLVTDHGAVRDLVESLAEGVRTHLADVTSRIPGAELVLQLDEPALPAVLGGRVPTASGYGTVRSVDIPIVGQALQDVLAVAAAGSRVVHCCAPDVPLGLLRSAGADALSVDASLLTTAHYDELGEAVEAGVSLWLGVLPSGQPPSLDAARTRVHDIWRELGFNPDQLAASVVPTPACGLAGASPEQVRRTFAELRDVGASLRDES